MTATITLSVDLDEAVVLSLASRGRQTASEIIREVIADLECTAFDSLRFKDAVGRLGVTVALTPAEAPAGR
jgi:hypothetical protein